MIIIEDSAFIFEEKFMTAIPLSIIQKTGNEAEITTYPETEHIAREFVNLYKADYFSDEAMRWLNEHITPVMKEKGYAPNKFTDRWLYNYEIDSPDKVNISAILSSTQKVISPKDEGLKNHTTYKFECECEDDDAYFCTIENKSIVSIASINTYPENSKIREIAVETCTRYQKRGYAASNTAALALYLSNLGYLIKYSCQRYNTASRFTAQKAGFKFVGKSYYSLYYIN